MNRITYPIREELSQTKTRGRGRLLTERKILIKKHQTPNTKRQQLEKPKMGTPEVHSLTMLIDSQSRIYVQITDQAKKTPTQII